MEKIIKTLLLEGIDEATIHRVLDIIDENAVDDYKQKKLEQFKNAKKQRKHYQNTSDKSTYNRYKKQKKVADNAEKNLLYAEGDFISSAPSEYSFKTKQEQNSEHKTAGKNYTNAVIKAQQEREKLRKIGSEFSPEFKNASSKRSELARQLFKVNSLLNKRNQNEQKHYGKNN